MKNKKSIAMAMAAVSTLGAVAPAFANEVAPLALMDTTVNYRLANGEVLVSNPDKSVRVLLGRDSLYNDNFTPNDKTDDVFKSEFKDAKIFMTRNTNDTNDANDLFVLVKKVSDASDISMEKAKLDAMIAEINAAKAEGATVKVGELQKAKMTVTETGVGSTFTDSQIVVTVTPKGEAAKTYTFNGVPGVEEEETVESNPFTGLVNTVDVTPIKDADGELKKDATIEKYYNLNKFKFVAEQNKDKYDFVKEQDETTKTTLNIKVYKKGAKQESKNLKFTMTLQNFAKLEKDLVINMAGSTDFASHWAKKEIEEAMLKGQVDVAANYRPQDGITRAEFAKIACTVFEIKTDKSYTEPFNDVSKADGWKYDYIAALYNKKTKDGVSVIQGDGENFRPNDKITRQEVAVIVSKLVSGVAKETVKKDVNGNKVNKVVKTKFNDTKSIADWADESVQYLNETAKYTNARGEKKAVVEGDNGYFNPTQSITRAESLVMVQRAASATDK